VLIVDGDAVLGRAEGPYGGEGHIRQGIALLPDFSGNRPVIGAWLVGDEACGMGIRESRDAITGNLSRFLPHVIAD